MRHSLIAAALIAAPALAQDAGVAEDQVMTGRFLTALEVKPILTATKPNRIAVRDWVGQDLVYVTQIWSWRCSLVGLRIGINGAEPEPWPLPACHADSASPNAITDEDGLPNRAFPGGAVETVTVELTYDDLSTDGAEFERAAVMMP